MGRRPVGRMLALALSLVALSAIIPAPAIPVTSPQSLPVATAEQNNLSLQFHLEHYSDQELPKLRVVSADGDDWSSTVDPPERQDERVSATLPGYRGPAKLAVEQFDYVWTLPDGKTVSGSVQFRDPRFPNWQWSITRTERLVIYHAHPLHPSDAETWEKLLHQAEVLTGQNRTEPIVVWVFPTQQALSDWSRYTLSGPWRLAGMWNPDIQRMMLFDAGDLQQQPLRQRIEHESIILHESIHALTPVQGPGWFMEGVADMFGQQYQRQQLGDAAPDWALRRKDLAQLQKTAREKSITTFDFLSEDPYALGDSIWLFVKHFHGQPGVRRLLQEGGGLNAVGNVLESLFQKPARDVWEDWNAYVRSDALLSDWDQL